MDDVDDLDLDVEENLPPKKKRGYLFGRHSFSTALLKHQSSVEPNASSTDGHMENKQRKPQDVRPASSRKDGSAVDTTRTLEKSDMCGATSAVHQLTEEAKFCDGKGNQMASNIEPGCELDLHNSGSPPGKAVGEQEQDDAIFCERARIPGPAGRLQQALRKKAQTAPRREATTCNAGECSAQLDVDFLSNAWTIGSQSMTPGLMMETLASALAGGGQGRIEKILLFVVDLRPNGEKASYAKLKDPTGSVGAIIHHTALRRHPGIDIGTVILLEKVAVFSPDASTNYLCIMPENIIELANETSGTMQTTLADRPSLSCSASVQQQSWRNIDQVHNRTIITHEHFAGLPSQAPQSLALSRHLPTSRPLNQIRQSLHMEPSNSPGSIGPILKSATVDGLENNSARSNLSHNQDFSVLGRLFPKTKQPPPPGDTASLRMVSKSVIACCNDRTGSISSKGSLPQRSAPNVPSEIVSACTDPIPEIAAECPRGLTRTLSEDAEKQETVMGLFREARNSNCIRTTFSVEDVSLDEAFASQR